MKIMRQISDSLLDSYAPLAAQCQWEYRLCLWRFTGRSTLCVCRTVWFQWSDAKVLLNLIRLDWNRLCCRVRSYLLADLYISKYNRHCLQRFEVNVSSVCHWRSLQAVTFLLSTELCAYYALCCVQLNTAHSKHTTPMTCCHTTA